jgi:hypothetical protein
MEESGKGIVIIDGSNAATGGGFRPPTLARLLQAKVAADAKWPTAEILIVVDANLRYHLGEVDRNRLDELCKTGEVLSTPSCTVGKGDAVLLAIAQQHEAIIVSNDCFKEFISAAPFLTEAGRVFGLVSIDERGAVLVARQLGAKHVA